MIGTVTAGVLLTVSEPQLRQDLVLEQTIVGIEQAASRPTNDEQVRALVSRAVDLALGPGGFANLVRPQDKVFIKINANFGATPGGALGYLTDPRVVRAVASLVAEIVPASQIKIGEGISHIGSQQLTEYRSGGYDMDLDGYLDGVPGVQLVCLNEPHNSTIGTSPAYVTQFANAPGHNRTVYYIPNVVANADVRISVPVLKTHDIAGLTAAMKNSFGIVPADIYYDGSYSRNFEVRLNLHGNVKGAIADINAVVPYQFAVVDALTAHRWGPWNYEPGRIYPHAILAGRDAVAVDTVAAAMIGWNPTSLSYLVYGQNDGTGVCDSGYIRVRGRSVQQMREDIRQRYTDAYPFPIGYGGSQAAETTPPSVTILSPQPDTFISGAALVSFACQDNVRVAKAELLIDGAPTAYLAYPSQNSTFAWDTRETAPGPHTVSVTVYDTVFNESSASVRVQVGEPGTPTPTPTPTASATPEPDRDQDGLPDRLEAEDPLPWQGNVWLPDSDADGLRDSEEDRNRNGLQDFGETGVRVRDSDHDGLWDGTEVLFLHSNPLDRAQPTYTDSDKDNLIAAFDPDDQDSDVDDDRFVDGYEAITVGFAAVQDGVLYPPLGDVSGDGALTNVDALLIHALFLRLVDKTAWSIRHSDVNGDGSITNVDALLVQSCFVGLTAIPLP